jgi:hypothetical protein
LAQGRIPLAPTKLDLTRAGADTELHAILIRSVKATFKGASYHRLVEQAGVLTLDPPLAQETHLASLLPLHVDPTRTLRFSVDLNSGDRFLAKLALGVGTALFGELFVDSQAASKLRRVLWERDSTTKWPEFNGVPFCYPTPAYLEELLNWNGCHVLIVARSGAGWGLSFAPYGRSPGSIEIDHSNDYDVAPDSHGMVWVIAPGLRRYVGPLSLLDFVAARLSSDLGPLAELQAHLDRCIELPPRHPVGDVSAPTTAAVEDGR